MTETQLTLQLKRLGKKKIKSFDFTLANQPQTLQQLIEGCIHCEVKRFNAQLDDRQILPFLSDHNISEQSEKGKVGFNSKHNNTLAIETQAIDNALLAFTDGLFAVFVDDQEIKELQQPIQLTAQSTITFIRMTFLTGTYW